MNPDLLAVVPAPSPSRSGPWALGYVEYEAEQIVAVLWWADGMVADGVRRQLADGTLDEDPTAGDLLGEPGWYWWIVGDEDAWPHDPRITVPNVFALGAATPGQVRAAIVTELAERPEPSGTRAESLALVERRLPWYGRDDEIVAALVEANPSIGTGVVVFDEDEAT